MVAKLCKRYLLACLAGLLLLMFLPYLNFLLSSSMFIKTSDSKSQYSSALDNLHIHLSEEINNNLGGSQVNIKSVVPDNNGKVDLLLSLDERFLLRLLNSLRHVQTSVTERPKPTYPLNVSILLHNATLCSSVPQLQWIIYVHSSPRNVDRRAYIRSTWANKDLFRIQMTQLVFFMGIPDTNNAKLDDDEMKNMKKEIETFGDIVIGDFIDNYKNLTLKAILGLKWVSSFCTNAAFAIKADDDAFLNIFEVASVIRSYPSSSKRLIACPLWKDNTMPILRDPAKCMKWCVSESDLPGRTHFPQYCAGLSFVLSTDIIGEMFSTALRTPFFWIDDVFVTGMVAGQLKGVHYLNMIDNFTLKEQVALAEYATTSSVITKYFVHIRTLSNFPILWRYTINRLTREQRANINLDILRHAKQIIV